MIGYSICQIRLIVPGDGVQSGLESVLYHSIQVMICKCNNSYEAMKWLFAQKPGISKWTLSHGSEVRLENNLENRFLLKSGPKSLQTVLIVFSNSFP